MWLVVADTRNVKQRAGWLERRFVVKASSMNDAIGKTVTEIDRKYPGHSRHIRQVVALNGAVSEVSL